MFGNRQIGRSGQAVPLRLEVLEDRALLNAPQVVIVPQFGQTTISVIGSGGLATPSVQETLTLTADATDSNPVEQAAGFTYRWTVTRNEVAAYNNTSIVYFATPGLYTATIQVTDQDGDVGTASGTYTLPPPNPPPVNDIRRFAVGSASGGLVSVYDNGSGTPTIVGAPYPGFTGGVAVAVGDVFGDGLEDIVTVVASDGPALVEVFDGTNFGLWLSFFAFPTDYTGGASVAVGGLDGYGRASIIVGQRTGGSAVAVYDGPTGALTTAFFAYPGFAVGANVATGDLNGDGKDEIITGPTGIAPLIRTFDGTGNLVSQFFAFNPAIAAVGVTVGAADLNGDPRAEILVGANVNGANYVLTFNGDTSLRNIVPLLPTIPPNSISPFGPPVAGADLNDDGVVDLLVTVGPVFGALDGRDLDLLTAFVPYPGYSGGLYVG